MKKFLLSLGLMIAIASSLSAFSLWNAVSRFFPEEGGCPESAASEWFQLIAIDVGWRGD